MSQERNPTRFVAGPRKEYRPALDYKNPAADVCQEHMDRVMAQIISGKQELIPFAERYPELKKVTYGGRK